MSMQSFRGAHRGRICVRVFMCVCVVSVCVVLCNYKKIIIHFEFSKCVNMIMHLYITSKFRYNS
jgi:ABC-type microcin C transport system permease subunit YejE